MDILTTSNGPSDTNSNDASLQQELQQAQLRQAQVQTQLQAQLLKQAKGPSTFRKVLGAVAGGAANFFAPGLGAAIGGMILGGNNSAAISPGILAAAGLTTPAAQTAGLDEISKAMQQNQATMEKVVAAGIQYNQNEMAELAALPKGPDPVAFLALTEKTNEQSEIFQATSAVAKAKHEAAMAAIQNIKD